MTKNANLNVSIVDSYSESFFNFTHTLTNFQASNNVVYSKASTFTLCSRARGKRHDSVTCELRRNGMQIFHIFTVHKMATDAPPDVTSLTFCTYFTLHASGHLGGIQLSQNLLKRTNWIHNGIKGMKTFQ